METFSLGVVLFTLIVLGLVAIIMARSAAALKPDLATRNR